jgi:inner membrane protein
MRWDVFTLVWLACGAGLISIEFGYPHFYSIFFGAGALLVGILHAIGLVDSLTTSLAIWFFSSVLLLITLRHMAIKMLHSESTYQLTDEDVEAAGQIVDVITAVSEHDEKGRVRFRGTTWPAISREGTIQPGQKARLLYRNNLIWRVEPYSAEENQQQKALSSQTEKES